MFGMMMGLWFLASAFGQFAGKSEPVSLNPIQAIPI
jgi:dipeptide/tripeptide permease